MAGLALPVLILLKAWPRDEMDFSILAVALFIVSFIL
jgi:hypothetical protein